MERLLLCIDVQPGFLRLCQNKETFLSRVLFCSSAAKLLKIPILTTAQEPEIFGDSVPEISQTLSFKKTTFSAWDEDSIKAALLKINPSEIVVIGCDLFICVFHTVVHLLKANFKVVLLWDATDTRYKEGVRLVLDHLSKEGCTVLPSETYFSGIIRGTGHPSFNPYIQLVEKSIVSQSQ